MHHQSHGHIYILFSDFFWKFCSVAFYNLFYDAYEINFSIECEACIEVHCFRYEHTNVPWHFIEKIILFKLNCLCIFSSHLTRALFNINNWFEPP